MSSGAGDTLTSRPGFAPIETSHLPPKEDTVLPITVAVTSTLLGLALITFFLRIYSRCRPYMNLGWDDLTITFAILLTIASFTNNTLQLINTGGRHTSYVTMPQIEQNAKQGFIALPIWIWSITLIKVSVFLMLLRIKRTKKWRLSIHAWIAFVLLIGILSTISQFIQCRPLSANWSLKMKMNKGAKHCWALDTQINVVYAMTAFFALTDLATALLPVIFIHQIQIKFREKMVLGFLMGLGLVACACGLVKPFLLKSVMSSRDPVWDGTTIRVWTYAEQYLGIMAANIPCLKSLLEKAFKALGGKITVAHSRGNAYQYYRNSKKSNTSLGTSDDMGYHDSLHKSERKKTTGVSGRNLRSRNSFERILMSDYEKLSPTISSGPATPGEEEAWPKRSARYAKLEKPERSYVETGWRHENSFYKNDEQDLDTFYAHGKRSGAPYPRSQNLRTARLLPEDQSFRGIRKQVEVSWSEHRNDNKV